LVPDKGLDRIFIFRFDQSRGMLTPSEQGSIVTREGAAPRHLAFHPTLPVVWVINESDTTTTYHWDGQRGALQPLQILPTVPPSFTGNNRPAEIVVPSGGRFVYSSNRGHDSIAVFAAKPQTALLSSVEWVSTQGKAPRWITLDPSQHFLYFVNELSDTIGSFRLNGTTGRLTPNGPVISNASPVAIAFASV